ncbi:hypothetical protein Syun_031233 [Stephania yunnanensis]|uniref:Protein unc-13 homolog n=1 Tax=Stephania yunnanensis TaxID=152371 RepID=A0AAP0DZ39_9MAGN
MFIKSIHPTVPIPSRISGQTFPLKLNVRLLLLLLLYISTTAAPLLSRNRSLEDGVELLQRYRRDRRVLLNFILSGSLIKKVVMPPGAVSLDDVDLDQVSVDHVLNCAKKGGMLELSEAIRDFHDSTLFPTMNKTDSLDEFFVLTNPESSGTPPRRAPPPIPVSTPSSVVPILSKSESFRSTEPAEPPIEHTEPSSEPLELSIDDIDDFEDDDEEEVDSRRISRRHPNDASDLSLRLPSFLTGITDDDLRETAFEILLASAGASGGLIVPSREKKKEKKSRLMRKLGRSKTENPVSQPQQGSGLIGLLETMRIQLEISEAMDTRTRIGLLNALVGKAGKRMDTILVPLELLCCISRTEFSDKKAYMRWQKRQLNMLEEGLVNHPSVGFGESGRKASDLRILLTKIEESESLPSSSGELQRTECLRSLRDIAIPLAERPARGDLTGEICHWADGYHLNVRLYEKLLLSVFDVLDEGKLTEEVEEILELLKSTWRILGITETMHYTCYTWVLFRQNAAFKSNLVHYKLKKIPLKEQRGPQERLQLKSLCSKVKDEDGFQDLSFLQSFLIPIQKWADKKLENYHLHFAEGPAMMEDIVTVAMVARRLLVEESDTVTKLGHATERDQIEWRKDADMLVHVALILLIIVDATAESTHEHSLASLAVETKKLLKKDASLYILILSKWNPRAAAVSACLLHKLYGSKLKPFVDAAEHLTEDVVSVFPAADGLEQYIMALISSVNEVETVETYCKGKLTPYQIETTSGTLVLRWVNSQLGRILEWVERAIKQEHWDPISPQQRHGSSIVEVYRIIEETVDQFFSLEVPMRPSELNSLFRGIDNAFQMFTNHVIEKFDDSCSHLMALCTTENYVYAVSQLNKLEDSIRQRWTRKRPQENVNIKKSLNGLQESSIDKNPFDGSRKDMNTAIDRICEFTGTKIIFWDLRDQFIDNLYRPSASQSRLEMLVEPLDLVLNQLCDVIVEPLRDRIVTGLLQASLEGLLRVLLDGGPSRVFSLNDARLLEEDLETLKEFFISGGDGLPRGTVENQVSRVRSVIKLHGCETRVLIDELKSASGLELQGNRSRLGADSQTLLRVLCHRCDSEASHFLKKQYKIPSSTS